MRLVFHVRESGHHHRRPHHTIRKDFLVFLLEHFHLLTLLQFHPHDVPLSVYDGDHGSGCANDHDYVRVHVRALTFNQLCVH